MNRFSIAGPKTEVPEEEKPVVDTKNEEEAKTVNPTKIGGVDIGIFTSSEKGGTWEADVDAAGADAAGADAVCADWEDDF